MSSNWISMMPRDMQIVGKGKCMLVGCRLTDLHLFALRYLHPERGKPVSRSHPEHARLNALNDLKKTFHFPFHSFNSFK